MQSKPYPIAENEEERNIAVRSYRIMDTPPDIALDEINELAAQICGCPVAYISFIEDDRFWFKSKYGLPDDFEGCPREIAFCSVTVCGFELVHTADLTADETFKDFHFVINDPQFRFYCSMPLVTPDGYSVGTICVMDFEPRELSQEQREGLKRLSQQTIAQLEHRRRIIELDETVRELSEAHAALSKEKSRADDLLTTILPEPIAREMIETGKVAPRFHPAATILFLDVKGFTKFTETSEPATLIGLLDTYFAAFDDVVVSFGLEKIKTIGDAYLAVAGVPEVDRLHYLNAALAALAIRASIEKINNDRGKLRLPCFEFRIGMHSGAVIAGVVGRRRFSYDIWGDAVNTAERMESHGKPGEITISQTLHHQLEPYFEFTAQGSVQEKGKAAIDIFHLLRLKHAYSDDLEGLVPNKKLADTRKLAI